MIDDNKSVYISNEEKKTLKKDPNKGYVGKRVLKAACLIIGGITVGSAMLIAGLPPALGTVVAVVAGQLSKQPIMEAIDYYKEKQEGNKKEL